MDYTGGEYGPDIVSDFLCNFMERHKDKPFFAYYPMILPHWPFEPTPDSPDWNPKSKGVLKGTGKNPYFKDMVAYTDKMVGKLVAKVGQLGLADNTLILFTGDNGTHTGIVSQLGKLKIRGGKGKTLDTGTHVPLIARWPGVVKKGVVSDALVDFSDFLPTLAETAGARLPADIKFDGRSFLPVLRGDKQSVRSWIYCWYERNGRRKQAKQLIRNQRYKLYADGRFFDLAKDRNEQNPLEVKSLGAEVKAIHGELKKILDVKVNDPVTKKGPPKLK